MSPGCYKLTFNINIRAVFNGSSVAATVSALVPLFIHILRKFSKVICINYKYSIRSIRMIMQNVAEDFSLLNVTGLFLGMQ